MKFASLFVVAVSATSPSPSAEEEKAAVVKCTEEKNCKWEKACNGREDGTSPCEQHDSKAVRCTVEGKSGADSVVDCSAVWKTCLDMKTFVDTDVKSLDTVPKKEEKCTKVNANCTLNKDKNGCVWKPLENCKCPAEKLGVAMVFFLAAVTTFM